MKKIVVFCAGAALVAGLLLARSVSGADDIRAQIEAANRGFEAAFAKGDAAGVAACYSPDAQLLPPGSPMVSGNAAVQAYWDGAMKSGLKGVKLNTVEAVQHGDTAIEVGTADVTGADGGRLDDAKYIVIWKRVDGKWKLHRDIWNSSLAAN